MSERMKWDVTYYKRNRRKAITATQKWQAENPDKVRQAARDWKARNQHKLHAHNAVRIALRRGLLVKQPCEICGAEKVEAHHEDYDRPLEVRWLCRVHHRATHRTREGMAA